MGVQDSKYTLGDPERRACVKDDLACLFWSRSRSEVRASVAPTVRIALVRIYVERIRNNQMVFTREKSESPTMSAALLAPPNAT